MNTTQIQKIVTEIMQQEPDGDYIQSVALFGSFLHGKNSEDSDIDLLFETRETMSLFQIGGIQYRLQERLGRKVDFVEKNSVIPQLRDKIIPQALVIYERK